MNNDFKAKLMKILKSVLSLQFNDTLFLNIQEYKLIFQHKKENYSKLPFKVLKKRCLFSMFSQKEIL